MDIVELLRWDKRYTRGHVPVTLEKAAAEIERLRAAMRHACVLLVERAHGPASVHLRAALSASEQTAREP